MKTVWKSIPIILLLALIIPMTATGEFYRYVDPHGNVIYTDDLSKVPVDKRPQARMYDESQSSAPTAPVKPEAAEPAPRKSMQNFETLKQERLRLQAVQEKLSQEYDELVKENAALKAEQQEAVTPDQIKTVNKKVVGYNARFKAYQEKEAAYNAEIKAYNQRVKDAEADKQEKN